MISTRRHRHEHHISVNAKLVRNINRAVILNFIRERQPISRARIAELSHLNKSTVSSIVTTLLDEGLVTEEMQKDQRVGRTPRNLRLRMGRHLAGAVYFDSATTHIAIVDIDGTIKHTTDIKTEVGQPIHCVARCLDELHSLRKRFHLPQLQGIGITVAGIVDSIHSRVLFAPNLGWEDVDLGAMVHDFSPEIETITVANDAKASALAELWFGRHDINLSNFVFLSVGRGIGTGVVVDKHVIQGESYAAGEFGHMTLIEGGETCACGNQGCWEAYASERAIVQQYMRAAHLPADQCPTIHLADLITAAKSGEVLARDVMLRVGQYLGMGIANIIKAVDPDAVIIGGRITDAWDYIYPEIMAAVRKRAFFGRQRSTTILPTSLTDSPPLLGAAALSIKKNFTDFRVTL